MHTPLIHTLSTQTFLSLHAFAAYNRLSIKLFFPVKLIINSTFCTNLSHQQNAVVSGGGDAGSYPSECPMSGATGGGSAAASYPSECPMSGATGGATLTPEKANDIDPTNMVRRNEGLVVICKFFFFFFFSCLNFS